MRIAAVVLTSFLFLVLAGSASASTIRQMTFATGLGDETIWMEDGITATGNYLDGYETPNSVHLDGFFYQWEQSISFTTGSTFTALSLDILALATDYCSISGGGISSFGDGSIACDEAGSAYNDPLPYVGIHGFLDGVLVSSLALGPPEGDGFQTLVLGGTIGVIDELVVEVLDHEELGLPGSCYIPCGHFNITNITLQDLTPVPEPSTGLLIGLGLSGLAIRRW